MSGLPPNLFRRLTRRLRKPEPFLTIDADEFERAKRDPKVIAFHEEARRYREHLIANGHCPQCLVVNCEHMRGDNG